MEFQYCRFHFRTLDSTALQLHCCLLHCRVVQNAVQCGAMQCSHAMECNGTCQPYVCQFDIDFYCSEFRLTRICLVISLCLNIIYREMGRNLPVCEDVVQVVFTLRSDGWSHSQIGVHFGKIFGI